MQEGRGLGSVCCCRNSDLRLPGTAGSEPGGKGCVAQLQYRAQGQRWGNCEEVSHREARTM